MFFFRVLPVSALLDVDKFADIVGELYSLRFQGSTTGLSAMADSSTRKMRDEIIEWPASPSTRLRKFLKTKASTSMSLSVPADPSDPRAGTGLMAHSMVLSSSVTLSVKCIASDLDIFISATERWFVASSEQLEARLAAMYASPVNTPGIAFGPAAPSWVPSVDRFIALRIIEKEEGIPVYRKSVDCAANEWVELVDRAQAIDRSWCPPA